MIKLFYGERGSGKTQRMVSDANAFAEVAKGNVVYLDRDFNRMHELVRNIRLINVADFGVKDYGVNTSEKFICFVNGLIAGDGDIQRIYIDSVEKLTQTRLAELKSMFDEMESICTQFGVEFALTVEGSKEKLPEYLHKYINE